MQLYPNIIKPTFDKLISFIGLVMLLPILLILMLLLSIANSGNPFFTQLRPGRHGRIFRVIKFKTMNDKKDENGNYLPEADRLTKIGKFVRSSSLDELPQLLNVLKGEMSLIGPRPLMPQYLPLYSKEQSKRHNVRPGITGWAQVNGRNAISWEQKFEYDVWYVDHLSALIDLKILLLTIKSVIKKDGIYKGDGIASMEAFNGTN
jgi:lipopolysaccharide/colanic/teichoic acid biosynthesis glycosyltransferase